MENTPTVFVIDDDTDDQEIFQMAMEQANPSVKCVFADDGTNAIKKFESEESFKPDLIFIDMNMPRMNGLECLTAIKKIERLNEVPVYMYSTSAEPSIVEQNKKLGAIDFIVKPTNINDLTNLLKKIITRKIFSALLSILCISLFTQQASAQSDSITTVKELKKLSVEQLLNVVVTSVSKTPEKLSEVASAIQVVTGEEIKRSGSIRLPSALRLASNMQVFTSGAHDTRISSRGFNGFPLSNSSLADKLLVLIDGRSVYTPLFGGVYWDVQNVLQEDIKQVEVISGPGGSLWGANAVNGIVNIISKNAKETQGFYATAATGLQLQDFGAVRYGGQMDTTLYYRVYAQRYDYRSSTKLGGISAKDAWDITQGGFRMDYSASTKSTFTLQGDLYNGNEDDTASTTINGQNIIGRWNYQLSGNAGITVQSYIDHTYRNSLKDKYKDEIITYDIDLQHNFYIGKKNRIIWGVAYRVANDNINSASNTIVPASKTLQLYSGFIQDQITIIPDRLDLTIGTKILHNDYTGFEFQPTVRLAYFPNDKHTVWAAVSRAVRTPTRFDGDNVLSNNFKSERLIAYELGYRARLMSRLSLSLATFYNDYDNLRSFDLIDTVYYFGNHLKATTYGAEFSANAVITKWWRMRGGYTWMQEMFTVTSKSTYPESSKLQAIDPANQFLIQSMMDVYKNFEMDLIIRYVDVLPAAINIPSVPSYYTFDLRLAYNYKWLTLSFIGTNLARKSHGSAGTIEIPRSGYVRLSVKF